ncbi:uncharacterized protein LOC116930644 isoform X1 [Daphnia magna]|uniref:uncharacterized protein LOC116930644 isoform X1 n=1 Tax=Daphnia magna TaxID=35525 RepID=UPI001E1BBA1E|nr:uncharacterized protein LOC116930644 isoform X1 [Daphnia magna]
MCSATNNQKAIQTAQKTRSSVLLCISLVSLFPFVHGLEICREDAECLTQGTYCLQGFCDGHCIPCQQFLRNPPYSGDCAKHEEDCGSCLPNTVAEELVGMRHAFRCKKVDEFIPAINTQQPFTIPEWLTWTLSVVAVLLTVTVATLYMTHKKNSFSRHDQLFGMSSPTPERNVTEIEMERDPLYNPDWQNEDEMIQPFTIDVRPNEERPLMERVNHVQAQPMNDPFGSNLGENLNPSAHRLLSDEPSHSEGSANNDVLTGVNEGVTVELSNYRNETRNQEPMNQREPPSILPSPTLPTSDGVPFSIEIEPNGSDKGSGKESGDKCYEDIKFWFLLKIKRIIPRAVGRENNNANSE